MYTFPVHQDEKGYRHLNLCLGAVLGRASKMLANKPCPPSKKLRWGRALKKISAATYRIVPRVMCLPCSVIQRRTSILGLRTIPTSDPDIPLRATTIFQSRTTLLRQMAPPAASRLHIPLQTPGDRRDVAATARCRPSHGGPGICTGSRAARSTQDRIRSRRD